VEGEQCKNGVFTYALLTGLKNRGADANKDQTITVSELQAHVIDQVHKLSSALRPVCRGLWTGPRRWFATSTRSRCIAMRSASSSRHKAAVSNSVNKAEHSDRTIWVHHG
jgi:hypothetical protein